MRIIWLSPYPIDRLTTSGLKLTRPAGGHACSWIINWAEALAKLPEVDLHIITYASRVPFDQSLAYGGYTVHVMRDAIPFTDRGWAGLYNMDARTGFKSRIRKLTERLEELQPDLVHGHGTEDAYGLAAVRSGLPSVVSIQGVINDYLRTNPIVRFKLTAKTERQTIENGKYFMCRTHYDKSFVKSLNPKAEIIHMPEPMNYCFFEVKRESSIPYRILHVGGFHERKGLEDMLKAFRIILDKFPDSCLDVVGSGEISRGKLLREMAQDFGVGEAITWHGFLSAEEIAELHSKAAVFSITSQNENSPNTLAEALCAGTPSVAYDVGGISSMFEDGKSGYLVQRGDVEDLGRRIIELFDSPELRKSFSEKARLEGQLNHPSKVAKLSLKAYTEIKAV